MYIGAKNPESPSCCLGLNGTGGDLGVYATRPAFPFSMSLADTVGHARQILGDDDSGGISPLGRWLWE
jgi:hypothetical protein